MPIKANTAFATSLIVVAAAVTLGSAALAEPAEKTDFSYMDMLNVPVKVEQALETATTTAKGTVVEIVMDEFNDTLVYLATIASPTSLSELVISAQDGSVIANQTRTAASPEIMDYILKQDIEFEIEIEDAEVDMAALELLMDFTGFEGESCEKDH